MSTSLSLSSGHSFPPTVLSQPSISRITLKVTMGSSENTMYSFMSSSKASEFLTSKKDEITKITKLSVVHRWGEALYEDKEVKSWSNKNKTLGDHEWKEYASGSLSEQYYYIHGDDEVSDNSEVPLTPLLAVSMIEEAEVGSKEELFTRALRKTESVMKKHQKSCMIQ